MLHSYSPNPRARQPDSRLTALWHKQVRVSGEGQARSPYYAVLEAAQQAAEAKGLGLWTKVRC